MRYASIDLLRTLAIFVMVIVHFGENLSGYTSPLVGFGAPLFAFLSGASYFLWVHGQEARGILDTHISKVSVRRGLFVTGVGFVFNVLVWLPEDTYNWDVLTFVGTMLLVLNGVRRIPAVIPVMMAVTAHLISPILRSLVDYNSYWQNGYFECDPTLSDLLIGYLVTGYFPVLPWMVFALSGHTAARYLFMAGSPEKSQNSRSGTLSLLGGSLMIAALGALSLRSFFPFPVQTMVGGWTMFPPSSVYVAFTLGLALLAFGVSHRLIDQRGLFSDRSLVLTLAKTFSRYSLTIYVLHHIVHLWPLWIYGMMAGQEPTYYWKIALPITVSIPLAFVFLWLVYLALRRLGPERTYGIESWMRWVCD